LETTFSPVSFGKFHENPFSRPENGCLFFLWRTEKQKKTKKEKKQKKKQKNICKTYTHPPHRRLRKLHAG